MTRALRTFVVGLVTAFVCAACATSPVDEQRRAAMEARINDILSQPLDPAVYGETKRCLADAEYRGYRILDNRRILFYGSRDRQWINTLRASCFELRHADFLVIRQFSPMRLCETDTFTPADWFDWPWYRRWPWHWGTPWWTGGSCMLGKFQPVTDAQLAEIEALLRAR